MQDQPFISSPRPAPRGSEGNWHTKKVKNGVTASQPFSDSSYGVTRGALMAPVTPFGQVHIGRLLGTGQGR